MMAEILFNSLMVIGTITLSIVFHEIGHYQFMRLPKINIDIIISGRSRKSFLVYISGILLGLIPILVVGFRIHPLFFGLLIPYFLGCKHDVKSVLNR